MNPLTKLGLALILVASPIALAASRSVVEAGPLLVVGGGGTPEDAQARFLELAGGPAAKLVVVPWASEREDRGESTVEMWREAGFREVVNADSAAGRKLRQLLTEADAVWMSGGSQNRLMETLAELELQELLYERHREGLLIGGTSAGAAVMSAAMVSGDSGMDGLVAGVTEIYDGLGLWPGVIVDQHFTQRSRYNRLASAVLDTPDLVGIGISERTAVLVLGDGSLEVLGQSNVVVIDARNATVEDSEPGDPHSAQGLRVDLLRRSSNFELDGEGEGR